MTKEELHKVLEEHGKWLRCDGGSRADLRGANLRGANLRGADLRGANLRGAYLREANLRGANLRGANLREANLRGANLRGANLRGAYLREAYLRGANLRGADLPPFQIPQEGELIVWKASTNGLVKLRIPPEARRTACLVNRKCRAAFAEVLEANEGAMSKHDRKTAYISGQTVRPDKYNDDIREDCSNGIHFFLTKEEAKEWL